MSDTGASPPAAGESLAGAGGGEPLAAVVQPDTPADTLADTPADTPADTLADTLADTPPDHLCANERSRHYDAAALERGIGVRFKGVEKDNVEEYCVSEGWVRVSVGRAKDRRGNPMTLKLVGKVEVYFRDTARDTARDAVGDTVGDTVRDTVQDTDRDAVGDKTGDPGAG